MNHVKAHQPTFSPTRPVSGYEVWETASLHRAEHHAHQVRVTLIGVLARYAQDLCLSTEGGEY